MTQLAQMADSYQAQRGAKPVIPTGRANLTKREGVAIADFYDEAKNSPLSPVVAKSYSAFKKESFAQWMLAEANGIRFEPTRIDPYPNLNYPAMRKDVIENHRLKVFTGGNPLPRGHPMSAIAPNGISYNVIFRGVHDLFGHASHDYSFATTAGEVHAFLSHAQMFSKRARGAMAFETLGQTAWQEYGRHPANVSYPPQKANVLPNINQFVQKKLGTTPQLRRLFK